jgi:hypothetical protein
MSTPSGYLTVSGTMTVGQLRSVLADADDDDAVHVIPEIDTGEPRPVRAAMVDDDLAEHRVYLYLDHPGES